MDTVYSVPKSRDWVLRLRDDHDEFLSEYRQRYEEILSEGIAGHCNDK